MEERFRVYTDGPGPAFKIEVNKIWIEDGTIFFRILDWNRTIGLPNEIFEHIKDDLYRFNSKNIHAWISHEKEKKTELKIVKSKLEDQEDYEHISIEELGEQIKNNLLEIRKSLESHITSGKKKFKQTPLRAFTFFTSRFKEELDKIKIPVEINKISLHVLSNSITKFLTSYKFLNAKPLPGFSEVQSELIELIFHTQKLEKQLKILKKKI